LKIPRNVSLRSGNTHLAVVERLLDTQAADINARSTTGRSPMFWAAADGHEGIVRLLLERNANPEQTALSVANQNGHNNVVDISRGA
jgi:ankyrin repeat protein